MLTFVLSFTTAGVYKILGGAGVGSLGFTLLGAGYMLIPALSVLLVEKVVYREPIKKRLLLSFKLNGWFVVAWLFMPLLMFVTIGVNLLFPGVSYNPEMTGFFSRLENLMTPEQMEQFKQSMETLPVNFLFIILLQGLLAGATVNALAAFGEELGWRGFLLDAFREMKFYKAALLIGVIWGIWHAPLILMGHNYPQHPQAGVFMMVGLCILISPLLLYVTIKARSVFAAAVMHGTMNATAGISIMTINGGNDLVSGIAGLAGFITLALFLLLLFAYDRFISKDKIFGNKISKFL